MTRLTHEHPGHHMLGGAFRVLLAEALFPITGLITAAFLTRRLGPEGYGLLVLAATLVAWVEWSINSFFSRATIKFIGEAEDWQQLGNRFVRLQLVTSGAVMILLWLLAVPLARLLDEPVLGPYLALFALDIPLFNLAQAHRNILVGKGDFAQCALASASRWISRLVLIVVLVEAGLSVHGAILGTIGASVVEVMMARRYVRPSLFGGVSPRVSPFWKYGLPLFLSAFSLSFFARVDLFALKILGGTTLEAGIYGAAQSLSLLPSVFAASFLPMMLSTLSRLLSRGEADIAREIGRNVLRGVLWLLPLAAIVAGAASEIITVFFGRQFESAAILLASLIFGSVAVIMISAAAAIFTAVGRPLWTAGLTGPLVPLAVAGHLLVIPRYGPVGASIVTALVALIGSLAAVWGVDHLWHVSPPLGTLVRSIFVSIVAFAVAALWPAPGLFVLLKLFVTSVFSVLIYLGLGEFSADEMALARSFLVRKAVPAHNPHEI